MQKTKIIKKQNKTKQTNKQKTAPEEQQKIVEQNKKAFARRDN